MPAAGRGMRRLSTAHIRAKVPGVLRLDKWRLRMESMDGRQRPKWRNLMRPGRRACLLILAMSLAACSSFTVNTDHDPTVDFSSFKTFAFAGPTEMNKGGLYD